MQKWQYKSVELDVVRGLFSNGFSAEKFQIYLNTLGEDGWELVSVVALSVNCGSSDTIIVTLKRPL